MEFFFNLENYLLKDDQETNDNLKVNEDLDFLNSSLDLTSNKLDNVRKNSALFSFNESQVDLQRNKKIRKESQDSFKGKFG
jgi:hypothetical protein